MALPTGPFVFLGKIGFNLYTYFSKGPKIDASLKWIGGGQKLLGASEKNPSSEPVFIGDAIMVYDMSSEYTLTIKNASKNPAYNIRLLNANDLFYWHDPLPDLASLDPSEKFEIRCRFFTPYVHARPNETDQYHHIPPEKVGKQLVIEYQNEARTRFYTSLLIMEGIPTNKYSLKSPL